MELIRLENVSKCFELNKDDDLWAVNDVSFTIHSGESLGLVGESGCGKSTLSKCILNLRPLTSGKIYFHGKEISQYNSRQMKAVRQQMQCVFQNNLDSFNPYFTVRKILQEPLRNYGMKEKDNDEYLASVLEQVGLDGTYLGRFPGELSGGQCQRVGIARALILEPEFIICDEAVSNLDYSVRNKILHLFQELKTKNNLTYLFISHDLSAVRQVCDRVIVMYKGEIMEIISDFREEKVHHPYTKALLAAALTTDPRKRDTNRVLLKKEEDLFIPKEGCVLQNRCMYATEHCRKQKPQLTHIGDGDYAACHYLL